jgi:hypothetical protein
MHVYELRKALQAVRARALLLTRPHGHTVDLPSRHLDVTSPPAESPDHVRQRGSCVRAEVGHPGHHIGQEVEIVV